MEEHYVHPGAAVGLFPVNELMWGVDSGLSWKISEWADFLRTLNFRRWGADFSAGMGGVAGTCSRGVAEEQRARKDCFASVWGKGAERHRCAGLGYGYYMIFRSESKCAFSYWTGTVECGCSSRAFPTFRRIFRTMCSTQCCWQQCCWYEAGVWLL